MIEGWGSGPESHKSTTTGVENPTSHKIKLNVTTGVTTGVEKDKVGKSATRPVSVFDVFQSWAWLVSCRPAGRLVLLLVEQRKKKDRLASPRLLGFLLMSGYFIYDGILCYLLYRVVLVVVTVLSSPTNTDLPCRHSLPTLAGKNTAITPPFNIGTITEKTVREIVNINLYIFVPLLFSRIFLLPPPHYHHGTTVSTLLQVTTGLRAATRRSNGRTAFFLHPSTSRYSSLSTRSHPRHLWGLPPSQYHIQVFRHLHLHFPIFHSFPPTSDRIRRATTYQRHQPPTYH